MRLSCSEPRPYDEGAIEPPAPLQICARLGVLLTIALGFGFTAQALVGALH